MCWPANMRITCRYLARAGSWPGRGIDIHRSTLADWVGFAAFHLGPVVDRLAEHLKASTKLFMDETMAPALDPGRGRTKTGYLWALARDDRGWGSADPPGYFYAPDRSGKNAELFLDGFDGILQIDGYPGYNRLTRPSRKAAIRSASRIAGPRKAQAEGSVRSRRLRDRRRGPALYRRVLQGRGRNPRVRPGPAPLDPAGAHRAPGRGLRGLAAGAASAHLRQVPPRRETRLHHRHWDGLQTFLADGRVEIDSNPVENLVRPIALNRKNALFAGHDEGGRAWGRIAALIETAKVNGVEPFAYLKATLEAIANGHPQNSIDDLLPWNFRPST